MSGAQTGQFRAFAGRFEVSVQVSGKERDVPAGAIFEHESEATGRANSGNGGRWERESVSFGQPRQLPVQPVLNGFVSFLGLLALIPRFESDKEKRIVGALHLA